MKRQNKQFAFKFLPRGWCGCTCVKGRPAPLEEGFIRHGAEQTPPPWKLFRLTVFRLAVCICTMLLVATAI
jgi:hypothetical protein